MLKIETSNNPAMRVEDSLYLIEEEYKLIFSQLNAMLKRYIKKFKQTKIDLWKISWSLSAETQEKY